MFKDYFLRRLRERHPDFYDTYDFSELPDSFHFTAKLTIGCPKHSRFNRFASDLLFGRGCLACSKETNQWNKSNTTPQFIRRSKNLYGDRFEYSKVQFSDRNTPVTLACKYHGEIQITPTIHFNYRTGCRLCDDETLLKEKLNLAIVESREVHGCKYDYDKVKFIKLTDKVELVCSRHGSFWQSFSDHITKRNSCPKCVIDSGRSTNDSFIAKSKSIHGDAYVYDKVAYETIASMVTIGCPKHGDFIQRAGSHLQGNGCKKCFLASTFLPVEQFIKKAREVHGDKYDYSKVIYRGNKTKVEIVCSKHGSFWQKPNTHTSSRNGCLKCSESKGETAIEVTLKKYGIRFIREYRIEPHRFRYDFYLPDFNIYIEYHGQQHYRPIDLFGGEKTFKAQQLRDEIKRKLVKGSGGKLLTLNYLTLKTEVVEKELIRRLKTVYLHWFTADCEIRAFRNSLEVYRYYDIDSSVIVRNLQNAVVEKHPQVKVLF